jgi:hypothetical protein
MKAAERKHFRELTVKHLYCPEEGRTVAWLSEFLSCSPRAIAYAVANLKRERNECK